MKKVLVSLCAGAAAMAIGTAWTTSAALAQAAAPQCVDGKWDATGLVPKVDKDGNQVVYTSGKNKDKPVMVKVKKGTAGNGCPPPVPPGPPAPDISYIKTEISLKVGGCGVDDELVTGTIGVKNYGNARAERLLAEPVVSVLIPDIGFDLKDDKLVPNSLAPNEIFSTDVHIGKGKIKDLRGLNGVINVYVAVDPYNKIPESNERNNLLKVPLTFKCKK